MRSRSLRRFKNEEGIKNAMLAMGVDTPQAVYHAIKIDRQIQIIELDGYLKAVEHRIINRIKQ